MTSGQWLVVSEKWEVASSSYHGSRFTVHVSRITASARAAVRGLLLALCVLPLAACSFPGSVKPTIKIGLSAPFEGLYRDEGYEALHAVRLAVRQRNEKGGVGGSYLVELVALNDFNEPEEAALQARKMAVDPDVMGVLGGWTPETVRAAAPEYKRLGLPFLAPEVALGPDSLAMPSDPGFVEGYEQLSGGAPPGPIAAWTYSAANDLMDALDAAVRAEGHPSREGLQAMLDKPQ